MVTRPDDVTLALDAATYEGSVALLRGSALAAECTVAMRGATEERLMPAVLSVLDAAGVNIRDVSRVVCGAGPGSFTSLRIAASIAKGIAFGNGIPLYAVSSLALIVAGAGGLAPGDYLAVLDAMRGERYVAPFHRRTDGRVIPAGDPERVAADEVALVAARHGAAPIGPLENEAAAPRARGAAPLLDAIVAAGPVALDAWEPAYGRIAEAQVKWEAAHGRPLGA